MREMHKWKDKVELSLDNRQIFFLFFGLSVVGCFVFALGVMVGRRVEFDPSGEVAALSADSLSLLDGNADAEGNEESELTFKAGLRESSADDVPPTRDPATVGMPAQAVLAATAAAVAEDEDPAPSAKPAAPSAKPAVPSAAPHDQSTAKTVPSKPAKKPAGATLASAKPEAAAPAVSNTAVGQKFTLQMKAFAKAEEADEFAKQLQGKGHKARVETHEVKGRLWHRVRVGEFDTWAAGLAAKENFETSEKTIAYVVRK